MKVEEENKINIEKNNEENINENIEQEKMELENQLNN